jgi:hypothetical protein
MTKSKPPKKNITPAELHDIADWDLAAECALIDAVIHDLRSPTHLALAEARNLDVALKSAPLRMRLEGLQMALDELTILTSNLADMARHGLEGPDRPPQNIPAETILAPLRLLFRRYAAECGGRLRIPYSRLMLRTHRAAVTRVLANLMSNALKHSTSPEVTLSTHARGDEVLFIVADHGCGLQPAQIDTLFSPPMRTAAGTLEDLRAESHGFGLYGVRRVVEALQGRIFARTNADQGLRVEVWIPASPQVLPPRPTPISNEISALAHMHPLHGKDVAIFAPEFNIGLLAPIFDQLSAKVFATAGINEFVTHIENSARAPSLVIINADTNHQVAEYLVELLTKRTPTNELQIAQLAAEKWTPVLKATKVLAAHFPKRFTDEDIYAIVYALMSPSRLAFARRVELAHARGTHEPQKKLIRR